jgi:hypothetical protein
VVAAPYAPSIVASVRSKAGLRRVGVRRLHPGDDGRSRVGVRQQRETVPGPHRVPRVRDRQDGGTVGAAEILGEPVGAREPSAMAIMAAGVVLLLRAEQSTRTRRSNTTTSMSTTRIMSTSTRGRPRSRTRIHISTKPLPTNTRMFRGAPPTSAQNALGATHILVGDLVASRTASAEPGGHRNPSSPQDRLST